MNYTRMSIIFFLCFLCNMTKCTEQKSSNQLKNSNIKCDAQSCLERAQELKKLGDNVANASTKEEMYQKGQNMALKAAKKFLTEFDANKNYKLVEQAESAMALVATIDAWKIEHFDKRIIHPETFTIWPDIRERRQCGLK